MKHVGVVAVFGVLSLVFGFFLGGGDLGSELVLAGALFFGLCYLYSMLALSYWVRKKFAASRSYDPRKDPRYADRYKSARAGVEEAQVSPKASSAPSS